MGVGHYQFVIAHTVSLPPGLDDAIDVLLQVEIRLRAGVQQQGAVIAEDQVQEGRLVVTAERLPQDVEVFVEGVDLQVALARAVRAAADPMSWKAAALAFRSGEQRERRS